MASLFTDAKQYFNRVDSAVRKLIIVNVIVFLFINIVSVLFYISDIENPVWNDIVRGLMLPPTFPELIRKPWTIITYMFMHASFPQIFHIIFNMLMLFWFGNILQDFLGNKKLYFTYFLGGIAGALFALVCYLVFPKIASSYPMVGASAAVIAIMAAAATLVPHYEMNLIFFGFVKLKWLAIIFIILDVLSLGGSNAGGHLAHLGGAIAGFIYIRQLREHSIFDRFDLKKLNIFKRRRKRLKVHQTITYMKSEKTYMPRQEEIDAILDKISVSGYESLSRDEKEILFKASQKKD